MKLLYCKTCDRYFDEARTVVDVLVRVKLQQTHESPFKTYKIIDNELQGRWTGSIAPLLCILGNHLLQTVELDTCPHEYLPTSTAVQQQCRFCGNRRYGKVVFDD